MIKTFGIDLGTTYSLIGHINQHGKPEVIKDSQGSVLLTSVVCLSENGVLTGVDAKMQQQINDVNAIAFFKRSIDDENFLHVTHYGEMNPIELSAEILKALCQRAQAQLNIKPKDVVITVPAYFKDKQRKATLKAAELAGLNVIQMINEPTAAALAYCVERDIKNGEHLVVYDLGGGTFDVTVVKKEEELVILNSEGDHQLGGKDWDDKLLEYINQEFKKEFGMDIFSEQEDNFNDFLVLSENCKKQLSTMESAHINIQVNQIKKKYTITRALFEEITQSLLERTIQLVKHSIQKANLSPAQVRGLILVGGSTRMPMIGQYLEKVLGIPLLRGINPDEAICLGATIFADLKMNPKNTFSIGGQVAKVKDVTNHSLGMIAIHQTEDIYINSIILPKNKQLPCQQKRSYALNGNQLELFLTQGESASPMDIEYLGAYVAQVEEGSHISKVDVTYHYNENGVVDIELLDPVSQKKIPYQQVPLPSDVPERFKYPPKHGSSSQSTKPLNVFLNIDLSGSMSGTPLAKAKEAALDFVRNLDIQNASIALMVYADGHEILLEPSKEIKLIEKTINQLKIGIVDPGLTFGSRTFVEVFNRFQHKVNEINYVVTLTDGVWGDQEDAIQQAQRCMNMGVGSIAIGLQNDHGDNVDEAFLRKISSPNLSLLTIQKNLVKVFSGIAKELSENKEGYIKGLSFTG
jgi:molecular chaperone DnaK